MEERLGASLEAWHHWSVRLGLDAHLLPVVVNPDAPISEGSTIKALGKTPSRYNFRKEVVGFPRWTSYEPTLKEIGQWESQTDYGICLQVGARSGLVAFDIDVPNKVKAERIERYIRRRVPGCEFALRYRDGTGKRLLLARAEGALPKTVIPVEGGMVEVLGDGQQFIAEGAYIKDGKVDGRYLWAGGWPTKLGQLTASDVLHVVDMLALEYATGDVTVARTRRGGGGIDKRARPGCEDPVAQYLLTSWEVRIEETERLFIRCPFDDEHTSESGATETAYHLAGTGGYERGHFKCLHAHCMGREDKEFLDAIGYSEHDFPEWDEQDEETARGEDGEESTAIVPVAAPKYIVTPKGEVVVNTYNFVAFLSNPEQCGRVIAWDDFSANIIWAPSDKPTAWRVWRDSDYAAVAMRMDNRGFKPFQPAMLRPAVALVAERRARDMAIEWSKTLPAWDGVKRIARFLPDYLHTEDTEYTRAVGRYIWTGHAGRLLDAGCKADMATIWYGRQGALKSTAISAMSPALGFWGELDMNQKDDDRTRKMRGKLVIEMTELSGLKGREVEHTKSFVARQVEEWTPKYKEFAEKYKRRFLLHGTSNSDSLLADSTGERRWLPFAVCHTHLVEKLPPLGGPVFCEIARIRADRDQLWAEGIHLFREDGVQWQDAERLAKAEHYKFADVDVWSPIIRQWLLTEDQMKGDAPCDRSEGFALDEVLTEALGKRAFQITKADQMRVSDVLKNLGGDRERRTKLKGRSWTVSRYVLEDGSC